LVTKVLDIPEYQLDQGAQTAISGPSGSGKSTFLNIIAGLLKPDSGSVNVCGENLTDLREADRDHFRAEHIGYIFQNFNLLQGYTALENVLLGMTFSSAETDREKAAAILEIVGLGHRMKNFPSGLSIGEQQRVAIARALIKKPELILADEPTGSLEIIGLLRQTCQDYNCTLILVSHEEKVVCDFEYQIEFLDLNRAFSEKDISSS